MSWRSLKGGVTGREKGRVEEVLESWEAYVDGRKGLANDGDFMWHCSVQSCCAFTGLQGDEEDKRLTACAYSADWLHTPCPLLSSQPSIGWWWVINFFFG